MTTALTQAGLLVDVTRCTGCNKCVDACVTANQLGDVKHLPQECPDGLSAARWLAIVNSPQGGYVRKSCRHCLDAACVSACPVAAMTQTPEGVVIYDSQKCMGCRYCMMACPFGIPRYEWDSPAPLVRKCTLCFDRLVEGKLPACVEACPERALTFGERSELLASAHQQLSEMPKVYLQKVYGEFEVGGTALMYISNVPLDFLGFNGAPGEDACPELTWEWLSKVPAVTIGIAGLMTGLFWIIGRRAQARMLRNAQTDQSPEES